MIEDNHRDPVLIMGPARVDAVIVETTGDVRLGYGKTGLRVYDRKTSRRIDLVGGNDAISRQTLGLGEILRGFPGHSDRSDFNDCEYGCRLVAAEYCLRVARQQQRCEKGAARGHRRAVSCVGRNRWLRLTIRRRNPRTRAVPLLRDRRFRNRQGENKETKQKGDGGRVWESNPPGLTS